jgi:hypothetical protein
MKEYERKQPLFSLCGLNCGLCPRYQSEGTSKCPGCGGEDFYLKHPSCAVITCSKKHGGIEFCFLCESYPCERYAKPSKKDSFITYQNVLRDMQRAAQNGIGEYLAELDEKIKFLQTLIGKFNDGKKKSFYCTAVNLLDREDLTDIREKIEGRAGNTPKEDMIRWIESMFVEKAAARGIGLKLRK